MKVVKVEILHEDPMHDKYLDIPGCAIFALNDVLLQAFIDPECDDVASITFRRDEV